MTEDETVDSITDSMDIRLSNVQEIVKDREVWHATVHGIAELDVTQRLTNRTTG